TGDAAGYGQVVPLPAESHPDLRLIWHAPVGPIAAPFTPFLLGVESIPPELGRHRYLGAGDDASFVDAGEDGRVSAVPQRVEATRWAVVTFKRLLYLLAEHHEVFLQEVTPVWEALERAEAERLATVVAQAQVLIDAGRAELARDLLTRLSHAEALRALDL